MAITTNVPTSTGLPKMIEPNQQVLKINNVRLDRPTFDAVQKEQGYYILLDVETQPIPDFEGFFIDTEDESKGRYEGQIGTIKMSKYYYKDSVSIFHGKKMEFNRDTDIVRQIKNICIATDCVEWLTAQDNKFNTIEELVEAFDAEKPFKGVFLNFCVAGKEYAKKNDYVGYDLYLPKYSKGHVNFEPLDTTPSLLLPFDESLVEVLDRTPVDSTPIPGEDIPLGDESDFTEEPEFEL